MKFKPAAAWLPFVLLSLSGAARADLEPFSVGASETVQHESNVFHSDVDRQSDWLSTTELRAALDQAIGRDRLTANAAVNYTDYRHENDRDAVGYRAGANLDWSTVGDISGSLGASSDRHVYIYGITEDLPATGTTTTTNVRNLETTNSASARIQLGGASRWNVYAAANALNRDYSADAYKSNNERQWSGSVGTNYSTSPDLSFGLVGNYVHGDYPEYDLGSSGFNSRSLSVTSTWQASGNSNLSAQLGYTTEDSDLQSSQRFVSGNLSWTWTPPSHFKVQAGLARSSSGGVGSGTIDTLNDRSLNTSANLDVTYALTAKVSLAADAAYIHRKYSGVVLSPTETIDGTNRTTSLGLHVHYQPTRITDISCGGSREVRSSGSSAAFTGVIPNYGDTTYQCAASIDFN